MRTRDLPSTDRRGGRRRAGARAVAAAAALTLGAAGALAALAPGASAAPVTVVSGYLDWGVDTVLHNEVLANGGWVMTSGGTTVEGQRFRFPRASGEADAETGTASLAFGGTVSFESADLFVEITSVRVTMDPAGGAVVADVRTRAPGASAIETHDDVTVGNLVPAAVTGASPVRVSDVQVNLTEAGGTALAGVHGGTTPAIAPLSVALWPAASAAVTPSTGLDPVGDTVTVTGSGFDPNTNRSVENGELRDLPAGVLVEFASVAATWRPSAGAPPSSRVVIARKQVLPAASRALVDPTGTHAGYATMTPDGTFSVTFDVANEEVCAVDESCAIVVHAAGGVTNAGHEHITRLRFAPTGTTTTRPPTTTTTPPPTGPTTGPAEKVVTDARVEWGVGERFREHVGGPLSNGGWQLDRVADNTGSFVWDDMVAQNFEPAAPFGFLEFRGAVRFTARDDTDGLLLDLTLANPTVRVLGDRAVLTFDVSRRTPNDPQPVVLQDVEFAALDVASVASIDYGDRVAFAGVATTVTAAGSAAFGGFYQPGEALDLLSFTVALDGAVLPPPVPGGPNGPGGPTGPGGQWTNPNPVPQGSAGGGGLLATTGATLVPVLVAGGALLVVGAGLLVLVRRRRDGDTGPTTGS